MKGEQVSRRPQANRPWSNSGSNGGLGPHRFTCSTVLLFTCSVSEINSAHQSASIRFARREGFFDTMSV